MDIQSAITELEKEWDLDEGFLGGIRQGEFNSERLEGLINILKSLELPNSLKLERRLVSLLWYIPVFLIWQKERFIEQGKDTSEFDHAINRIDELLEKILGIP